MATTAHQRVLSRASIPEEATNLWSRHPDADSDYGSLAYRLSVEESRDMLLRRFDREGPLRAKDLSASEVYGSGERAPTRLLTHGDLPPHKRMVFYDAQF